MVVLYCQRDSAIHPPEGPNTPPTSEINASSPSKHHPAMSVMTTRYGPVTTQSNDAGSAAR